jgi:hypothetical protein
MFISRAPFAMRLGKKDSHRWSLDGIRNRKPRSLKHPFVHSHFSFFTAFS